MYETILSLLETWTESSTFVVVERAEETGTNMRGMLWLRLQEVADPPTPDHE